MFPGVGAKVSTTLGSVVIVGVVGGISGKYYK